MICAQEPKKKNYSQICNTLSSMNVNLDYPFGHFLLPSSPGFPSKGSAYNLGNIFTVCRHSNYCVVLINDENHSYRNVIDVLKKVMYIVLLHFDKMVWCNPTR